MPLPTDTEKELLKNLISPLRFIKFSQVCKSGLYGSPSSQLRKKVQNRRNFLIKLQETNPNAFLHLCKAYTVGDTKDQAEPDPDIDKLKEPDPDVDKLKKQHQKSSPPDEVQSP